jgi:hypothetical protein
MTKNEKLLERAKEAINELFSDQSVSPTECKENLQDLKDEIELQIDSLGLEEGD